MKHYENKLRILRFNHYLYLTQVKKMKDEDAVKIANPILGLFFFIKSLKLKVNWKEFIEVYSEW